MIGNVIGEVMSLAQYFVGLLRTSLYVALGRTFVASNTIQTIDNEILYLILFKLHLIERKFDV